MQDFKHRRSTPKKPWLKRRFRLSLGRRKSAALPKGFRPLPAPPEARRERPVRLPRLRLVRPPLAVAYTAILVWLLAGVAWNGWGLLHAPLAKVRLSGNARLTGAQVLTDAGLAPGMAMTELEPIAVTRRLAANPLVAAVDVRRVYPGAVWIDVRERTADLRLLAGETPAAVDRDNVLIQSGAMPAAFSGLPVVTGVTALTAPGSIVLDPALRRARDFLALAREQGLGADAVAEIDAGRPYMLTVRFSDGRRALFSADDVANELRILRDLAAPLGGVQGRTVDLRAASQENGRIVLRP